MDIHPRTKKISLGMFLIILLIGIYLRFDNLTTVPPSLSHDEAAIAFNAYSILKTGKDEYGISFPILFRSFDDYKLPGMVYSTVFPVAIFGKTELAARLPSAIYGVLAIIVMYYLTIELLGKHRWILYKNQYLDSALLPPLIFAIQPWHINFSRQLFESNGAVFWFLLGTYFLLKSKSQYNLIFWAGMAYVTSLYFYYSVRLVIPFVGLLYIARHWNTIVSKWKTTGITLIFCVITFLPLGIVMLSPGGLERISIVSVNNDPNFQKRKDDYVQKMGTNPSLWDKIRYNRRVALAQTIGENYAKNISSHNLFVTGTGTFGALYPYEAIFIITGLISVFALPKFSWQLILIWLICAFLPGAFSINQPNTLRTLVASPALAILSGFGLRFIFLLIIKNRGHERALFFATVILLTTALYYFPKFHYAYFSNNPQNNAIAFADGNKQMIDYVQKHHTNYDYVYISGFYWRPYIFMLYWGNIEPSVYQQTGTRDKIGKYTFTAATWDTSGIKLLDPKFNPDTLSLPGKTLYILSKAEFEHLHKHFKALEWIDGRHAQDVFVAAEEQ